MSMRRLIWAGLCALALTACATTEQAGGYEKAEPSGFLKDYSKLRAAENETEATLVYFTPDKAKFKSYTKILLEPVQVWRGEKSATKVIDREDANYLSQYLYLSADEELRKDYAMIQQPGPGVMRIRIGITETGKGVPGLDSVTAIHPGAILLSKGKQQLGGTKALVGAASVEMEATDSQTGELLAAAVDRRGGGKYAWKSLNQWADVEWSYTYWAKKMRWRACEMRGGAKCERPED